VAEEVLFFGIDALSKPLSEFVVSDFLALALGVHFDEDLHKGKVKTYYSRSSKESGKMLSSYITLTVFRKSQPSLTHGGESVTKSESKLFIQYFNLIVYLLSAY
jgi:hypothetical protein